MNEFEKVEKLRDRAQVSYEEAKKALEESNWDLLDAMILLEKQGKTQKQEDFSTKYEEQKTYTSVEDTVNAQKAQEPKKDFGQKMGNFFKKASKILTNNYFYVNHKEKNIIKVPLWIMMILLVAAWKLLLIVLFVALIFGIRYEIKGKDEKKLESINKFMDQAADVSDKVKDEFDKL